MSAGPGVLTRPDLSPPRTRRARRLRFRADIEGMRAVAVLLVVAYHEGVGVVSGGFVGVDVFFVLSGFLITGLLVDEIARTGSISLADFYARRIRRLLPLSALVLAATALATLVLVPPIDRRGGAGDLVGAALWGANWKCAAESTQYMADTDKSPVLHYWSLAVEEQFYVVWPLLLLLLVGSTGLALRAWPVAFRRIALALAVVVGGSLALSWAQTDSASPFAYFGLHTRAWELGVGAGLALLRPVRPVMTRRAARGAAAIGAAMVLGSAGLMDETTPFPGTAALVPVLGTALLVAAGARHPDGAVSRALSGEGLRYVGRISYAWYLWHWPVLVLATATWGEVTTDATGGSTTRAGWSVVLAAVLVSFVLAAASHHAVEQPLRRARFLVASRRRSLVAGGVLVVISLVASAGLVLSTVRAGGGEEVVAAPRTGAREPAVQVDRSTTTSGSAAALVADPAELVEPNTAEEARDDTPDAGPCYVGYDPTSVASAEECRVGPATGSEVTVALIGDSHATAWYPAFRRAAEERGWTVYFFGKSACSVVDVDVRQVGTSSRYDACTQWRAEVLDRVAGIEGLDAVVVGRWMAYGSSTFMPDGSLSTPASVGPVWGAGAERTVERLRQATERVVVMEDVPWPLSDVPACLSEHPSDVEACSFPTSDRAGLDAALLEAEQAAAPRTVHTLDMTDVICPESTCHVVSESGQVKYRDEHHLTAGYSASLWPVLSERLEAVLR